MCSPCGWWMRLGVLLAVVGSGNAGAQELPEAFPLTDTMFQPWMKQLKPEPFFLLPGDLPTPMRVTPGYLARPRPEGQCYIPHGSDKSYYSVQYQTHFDARPKQPQEGEAPGWLFAVQVARDEAEACLLVKLLDPSFRDGLNDLQDPRLVGRGGSLATANPADGIVVRYGRLLARLWYSTDPPLCPELVPAARRFLKCWLDKVAPQASAPPKLFIDPKDILLSTDEDNPDLKWEDAADQQSVLVTVQNVGSTPAEGILLRLFAGPDEGHAAPVTAGVAVPSLAAKAQARLCLVWDLKGQNVSDTTLFAKLYERDHPDSTLTADTARIQCSVCYAHNGQRAFSLQQDAYSFRNWSLAEAEVEETIEAALVTVAEIARPRPEEQALLPRLLLPWTYTQLRSYVGESYSAGFGGHCFGMAASAAAYFKQPELRPAGVPVSQLTRSQASAGISLYHRAWFPPLLEAALSGQDWHQYYKYSDLYGPKLALSTLRFALRDRREPLILYLSGEDPRNPQPPQKAVGVAHAILGYKLIEVQGRQPIIYVYDSNFPLSALQPGQPLPQLSLNPTTDEFLHPRYMGYCWDWAYTNALMAFSARRKMPVETVNALYAGLKQSALSGLERLRQAGQQAVVARCPVELVVTDAAGRRCGLVSGQPVSEIPGAQLLCASPVTVLALPRQARYTVLLRGLTSGQMGVDFIRPGGPREGALASFDAVTVQAGTVVRGTLEAEGGITSLQVGAQTVPLKLQGKLDLDPPPIGGGDRE